MRGSDDFRYVPEGIFPRLFSKEANAHFPKQQLPMSVLAAALGLIAACSQIDALEVFTS